MSLGFARPEWLLLLLLLPALALWMRRSEGSSFAFPRSGSLATKGVGAGWLVANAPRLLRFAALVLLILALARPRTVVAVTEEPALGVPIVVAIDVSSSMLAQDFGPTDRLEVARRTVARFVEGRPDDPVGVVAFAAEALTLVPVTTLDAVVLSALATLRVGLLDDGTAIGDGLATAVNRVRAVEAGDRVVILMSDGESNRGEIDPLEAARAAAAFGVRVFTIGIGSDGVAPVPVRAPEGVEYAELPVGLDEEVLRGIAETTGGSYFRATDPAALDAVYRTIDELVGSPQEPRRFVEHSEWYLALLMGAAGAVLGEWLLRGSRWGVVP